MAALNNLSLDLDEVTGPRRSHVSMCLIVHQVFEKVTKLSCCNTNNRVLYFTYLIAVVHHVH